MKLERSRQLQSKRFIVFSLLLGALVACENESSVYVGILDDNKNSISQAVSVTLNWNPNPGNVDGYVVYVGDSANTATQQLTNIPVTAPGFDMTRPAKTYNVTDLGALTNQVCFKLRAYNSAGFSPFTDAVCSDL